MAQENEGKYLIADEEFRIVEEGAFVSIVHPHWSLNGVGKNLSEAVMDIYKEAEIVADMFSEEPQEKLSRRAQKFQEFLNHISKKRK